MNVPPRADQQFQDTKKPVSILSANRLIAIIQYDLKINDKSYEQATRTNHKPYNDKKPDYEGHDVQVPFH